MDEPTVGQASPCVTGFVLLSFDAETRYSPAICIGTTTQTVQGNPKAEYVSTSHVERQNLTMRMSMRRFTRLTNAFSKKVENLEHAVALHFMYYNFCRPHMSLNGLTPAQRIGIADGRWSIERLVGLLDGDIGPVEAEVAPWAEPEKPRSRRHIIDSN